MIEEDLKQLGTIYRDIELMKSLSHNLRTINTLGYPNPEFLSSKLEEKIIEKRIELSRLVESNIQTFKLSNNRNNVWI